ncbi:MAG: hypothetical protein MPJ24_09515 [Pirellulaceae bacterium]|nr:hypothetical protein [Pirellulaceae bacterium]
MYKTISLLLGLAFLGFSFHTESLAQQSGSFRTVSLKHAKVANVATNYENVLKNIDPNVRVIPDTQRNELLVQGNLEVYRQLPNLSRLFDKPPAQRLGQGARTNQSVAEKPVATGYSLPLQELAQKATYLKSLYQENRQVTIVTDTDTSQIIVMAPQSVHRQIRQQLRSNDHLQNVGQFASFQNQPLRQDRKNDDGQNLRVTGTYQLKHKNWQQFENALVELWGSRLTINTRESGRHATYQLTTTDQVPITLDLDRQTGKFTVDAPQKLLRSWENLLATIDNNTIASSPNSLISIQNTEKEDIQRAINILNANRSSTNVSSLLPKPGQAQNGALNQLFQTSNRQDRVTQDRGQGNQDLFLPPTDPQNQDQAQGQDDDKMNIIGPVRINYFPGLDAIHISGHPRDVAKVRKLIDEIENLSGEIKPEIELYEMKQVDSLSMATLVEEAYTQILQQNQGQVTITPLIKPNALMLIGRSESIATVIELIEKLDTPVDPNTQLQVYQLKYLSAENLKDQVDDFYGDQSQLSPRVVTVIDIHTNALIVRASPRDQAEIALMISQLDVNESAATDELRTFQLRNAIADDLAQALQDAINGEGGSNDQTRTASLTLATLDTQNSRIYRSSLLDNVTITAEARSNSLLVRGPTDSMPLIAELIRRLDTLPDAEAVVKVFTIRNADATQLSQVLVDLFGQPPTNQTGNQPTLQSAAGANDTSLVPLRFAVDLHTNTIVATGSAGDLSVVEALLLRLDAGNTNQKIHKMYRLRYVPAQSVVDAIDGFLQAKAAVGSTSLGTNNAAAQIENEVAVVAEGITNTLILSTPPRFFDQIHSIITELDKQPPMVAIQVLIAEVELSDQNEFGVEIGLQDSILFNRSTGGVPGFNFNGQPLGTTSFAPGLVAAQGVTNFATGRSNGDLGYGGFVFSASNESVSVLVRALQDNKQLEVLSRPQLVTMDNITANIHVGATISRVAGTTITNTGTQSDVTETDIGLTLEVTPRVTADNQIVIEVQAENSSLGPESEGVPISNDNGVILRSPNIRSVNTTTTVRAGHGQTLILGGMITKEKSFVHRGVPWLSELPIAGRFFGFEGESEARKELILIMTPYILQSEQDIADFNMIETERINWCLSDVADLHGEISTFSQRCNVWGETTTEVIYPDENPLGTTIHGTSGHHGQILPPSIVPTNHLNNDLHVPSKNVGNLSRQQTTNRAGDVAPASWIQSQGNYHHPSVPQTTGQHLSRYSQSTVRQIPPLPPLTDHKTEPVTFGNNQGAPTERNLTQNRRLPKNQLLHQ